MSFKTIKYFKQSESNTNDLVALDAWQVRAMKNVTSHHLSSRVINSVSLKVFGKSYQFSYGDLTRNIQQDCNYILDLTGAPMPIAIRAIQGSVYVIERPPFKTSVRLSPSKANMVRNEASIFCDVWIPWTVSILTMPTEKNALPSLRMLYNDGPLSSREDILIAPWTPNLHHTGDICLGQTIANFTSAVAEGHINSNNVSEVYHYLINDYFNGGWNLDLGGGIIRTICNLSIGKFTTSPLEDPDLAARAINSKVKIKNSVNFRSRELTRIKNAYLTWSLMDLSEVLHAVKQCTKQGGMSYKVSDILTRDKDINELNEKESISLLLRSIYLSDSPTFKNGVDWSVIVNFSKEVIVDSLIRLNVINTIGSVEDYQTSHANSICERAARSLIEEHEELFLSFMKSSLDIIANNILDGSTEFQEIEVDFNDIVNEKEYCVSALEEKSLYDY